MVNPNKSRFNIFLYLQVKPDFHPILCFCFFFPYKKYNVHWKFITSYQYSSRRLILSIKINLINFKIESLMATADYLMHDVIKKNQSNFSHNKQFSKNK